MLVEVCVQIFGNRIFNVVAASETAVGILPAKKDLRGTVHFLPEQTGD
jgi:hypothetical protein